MTGAGDHCGNAVGIVPGGAHGTAPRRRQVADRELLQGETGDDDRRTHHQPDLQHMGDGRFDRPARHGDVGRPSRDDPRVHCDRRTQSPFHNISPATTAITPKKPHVNTPTRNRLRSLPPVHAPSSTPAATGPAR